MPSPPTGSTTTGVLPSYRRITIESMCSGPNNAEHTSDAALAQVTRPQLPHLWNSQTIVDRPSPRPVLLQQHSHLAPPIRHCQVSGSDTIRNHVGAYAATDSTNMMGFPIRAAEDAINRSIDSHFNGSWSMVVSPTSFDSGDILRVNHVVDDQVRPTEKAPSDKQSQRIHRSARFSYTEEQKFFVMYYRIIRGLSWPVIEDKFADFFDLRTRDGLTSVYYRLRKDWGMEKVLKADSSTAGDRGKVKKRSCLFEREFLVKLGYLDSVAGDDPCNLP
jgi:hypothetical protein